MSIRVENLCQARIPFNIESAVRTLLLEVPPQHLLGLDAIIIVDRVRDKKNRQAGGIYRPKERRHQPAVIEIAVSAIYGGMPRIFFFLPFIAKFMLANVLFHEIGHHYQRFTHGVTKAAREDFAEMYKRQKLGKAFFWWQLLLSPLTPLIRWLSRVTNKRTGQDSGGRQNPET